MNQTEPKLFGLPLTDLSFETVVQTAAQRTSKNQNTWIVTVNPEILLHAHRDAAYHSTLQKADMRVVDGFGAQLFSGVTHRITGVALSETILEIAADAQWRVVIIARPDGLSSPDAIAQYLKDTDGRSGEYTVLTPSETIIDTIKQINPQLILCNLGFPQQEEILASLQPHLNGTISIGIGGALDYFLGTKQRAPRLFEQFGFEWLWRLIQQPSRWKRIFNAVIIFPLALLYDRLKK